MPIFLNIFIRIMFPALFCDFWRPCRDRVNVILHFHCGYGPGISTHCERCATSWNKGGPLWKIPEILIHRVAYRKKKSLTAGFAIPSIYVGLAVQDKASFYSGKPKVSADYYMLTGLVKAANSEGRLAPARHQPEPLLTIRSTLKD
jgi:hypothetical protein